MKRILFFLLSNIVIGTFAQTVNWCNYSKVNAPFNASPQISGYYIGNIDGYDFFTYYSGIPKKHEEPLYRLAFCKTMNNQTINSSSFTTQEYNLINHTIVNNLPAIIHLSPNLSEKSKNFQDINIDFFDPNTLLKKYSDHLLTYEIRSNFNSFCEFISSPDLSHHALVVRAILPDMNKESIIIKCYDSKLNELWTNYYIFKSQGTTYIHSAFQNNNGLVYLSCLNYDAPKKNQLVKFELAEINSSKVSTVTIEPEKSTNFNSLKSIQIDNHKLFFAYNDDENLMSYSVDFEKNNYVQFVNNPLTSGNWVVSNISNMDNGNFIISLENKLMQTLYVYDEYRRLKYIKYNYLNGHILFLGLNIDENKQTFNRIIARSYDISQQTPTKNSNILINPFYFVRGNSLFVIYNSINIDQPDFTQQDNNYQIEKEKKSKHPLTKMCIVNEKGELKLKTLFTLQQDKGFLASTFSYIDQKNNIIIAKCYKKYLTFGKINFDNFNQFNKIIIH